MTSAVASDIDALSATEAGDAIANEPDAMSSEAAPPIADAPLELGATSRVQHLGVWLMLAAVKQLG